MALPRVETIEGQRTLVEERTPPLPPRLDALLASMFALTVRRDLTLTGTRQSCEVLREHPFVVIREGRALCTDRVLRDLRVEMCPHCGAVCVRDISYDRFEGSLAGLSHGRRGPARRNAILGWYSGARRNSREYR